MRKKVVNVFAVPFLVVMLSLQAFAVEAEGLSGVVEKKIDVIMALLQNKELQKEQRDTQMIGTIEELFDFDLMAKLSLGKKEWSTLDVTKKKEYTDVYVTRLKRSYLDKLYLYTDEQVRVEGVLRESDKRVQVPAYILDTNGKTQMLYKFYKAENGEWLIYDVEIAGVSFVKTYRTQFSGILKTADMEGLIARLKSSEPLQ